MSSPLEHRLAISIVRNMLCLFAPHLKCSVVLTLQPWVRHWMSDSIFGHRVRVATSSME
ncbi:hypothetical protein K474DRAFT_623500 [Panus rudis PR-1116 ss-1]|nr:hypothetical protein K474DRAFT_623500 [Panus rudis PR-1116 ss-1]